MTKVTTIYSLSLLCSALFLGGCGGSGTEPVTAAPVTGGTQLPPTATLPDLISGSISSISANSLTINDRQLDISGVTVSYADATLASSALVENMKISVKTDGVKVTGIELNPDVAGIVSATSADQIQVNTLTIDIAALTTTPNVGDYVAVSADTTASTQPSATAVMVLSGAEIPTRIELEGAVEQLDASQQRFVVNGLQVDYAQAQRVPADLANGRWVEVFGSLAGQQIIALEIETERYTDSAEAEIEGTISWVDSEQQRFELNQNLSFTVLPATRFEDGSQQDLAIGRTVEVTSRFVNGEATLMEVDFKSASSSGSGGGAATTATAPRFALSGQLQQDGDTLLLNGFVFHILSSTIFDDGLTRASLEGVQLEIEGVKRNGQLQILEIERADTDLRVDLKGQVTQGAIWGYVADDQSLAQHEGNWVELECDLLANRVSACQLDD